MIELTMNERCSLLATLAEAIGGIQQDRTVSHGAFVVFDENGLRDWNPLSDARDTQQVAAHFGLSIDYGRWQVHYTVGDLQCTRTSSWPETLPLRVCLAGVDVAKQSISLIDSGNLSLRQGDAIVVRLQPPVEAEFGTGYLLKHHAGVRKTLKAAGIPLKDDSSCVESGQLSCSNRQGNELEFVWRPQKRTSPCTLCNDSGLLPDGTTADLCWACS